MAITHTNRFDLIYHLQATTTKTGKVSYSFTTKTPKSPVDEIPEGFEIFETAEKGQAFLRRIKPALIRPLERDATEIAIRHLTNLRHFIVEVVKDSLVIHTPGEDMEAVHRFLRGMQAPITRKNEDYILKNSRMMKMLRFILVDPEERLFRAERWCFRGRIDDWVSLMGEASPLSPLLSKYIPSLDKESFFEMF